jgi:8-oxo-dGTP pyrophosphatase MutT (NUDIX family)
MKGFEKYSDGYYLSYDNHKTTIPNVSPGLYSPPRKRLNSPQFSFMNNEQINLTSVGDMEWQSDSVRKITRAGCLFYTFIDGEIYFCMGRDKISKELTDFGGGRKNGESILDCAIRECNEETHYAFGIITEQCITEFFCLWNENMIIILVPVMSIDNEDVRTTSVQNFANVASLLNKNGRLSRCYDEVEEITWLSYPQMKTEKLYEKVRRFLTSWDTWKDEKSVIRILSFEE